MTRRATKWWSALLATDPSRLLKRPEGIALVELLTDWWISGEGLLEGRADTTDHGGRAAKARYSQTRFYQLLTEAGFPELSDRDEHAVDQTHNAFRNWAASRRARKLISRIRDQAQAREAVRGAIPGKSIAFVGDGVSDDIHRHVSHSVHEQIHAHVHHQVHDQVHHAVSHAVHDAGASGHAGGGHGGH